MKKKVTRKVSRKKREVTELAKAAIQSTDWNSYTRRVREDVAPKIEAYAEARTKSYERTLQYAVS